MVIIMLNSFLITFLSGISTVIGALFIFLNIKNKSVNKFITFCLSFSAAIMIGLSITELIPFSFFNIIYNYGVGKGQILVFIAIILAYIIVKILNKYMDEINSNDLYKLGVLSTIALVIHNLPEGIIVFASSINNPDIGIKLAIAIACHNIPEGITIAVPIYYATKSRKKALLYALIAGLAEPIGGLITYIFLKDLINTGFINMTLLFVGSLMILLAVNEIYPKALEYQEKKSLNLGLLIGILIIIISSLFM